MKIYFAAPFFNAEQQRLNTELVQALEAAGHKCWVPQRDGIFCPKDASKEQRRKVFDLDVGEIDRSDIVVAVLDYLGAEIYTPRGPITEPLTREKLRSAFRILGGEPNESDEEVLRPAAEQMMRDLFIRIGLPDTGTIYECGYAQAKAKPVIGFTKIAKGFNLMLSEGLVCLVHTVLGLVLATQHLQHYFDADDPAEQLLAWRRAASLGQAVMKE